LHPHETERLTLRELAPEDATAIQPSASATFV
jgi:hypothetical protein